MQWSASGAAGRRVSSGNEDLQAAIREAERELDRLYQRRRYAEASAESSLRLRIRGSPVRTRVSSPRVSAPPTPPLVHVRSPESVIVPLTLERRRLPSLSGSATVRTGGAAFADPVRRTPPPTEFAMRLSRLLKAVASVHLPHAAAPSPNASRGSQLHSLIASPITASHRGGDVGDLESSSSSSSFLAGLAAFLRDDDPGTRQSRNAVDDVRHVRFSSQSPRVATFSVERPCPDVAETSLVTRTPSAAMAPAAEVCVERLTPGPELDLVRSETATPRRGSLAHGDSSSLLVAPYLTSRISTLLPPRRSVTPRLSETVARSGAVVDDSRAGTSDSQHPQRLNTGQGHADKNVAPRAVEGRVREAAEEQAVTLRRQPGLEPSSSPCTVTAVDLSGLLEGSPIFLRRRERCHVSPRRSAPAAPLFANVTNQLPTGNDVASRTPSQVPGGRSRGTPAPTRTAEGKKRVRFRESVERADGGTGRAGKCPRRRRVRGGVASCVSTAATSPAAGVPNTMPEDLCCEQPGLGADILLACGPTLFFD
ncbi:hypothetical protein NESM_000018300 [Novymonas esmeraldas]|uniref:Uncharacterized protein n=1 Tax=Novymonas esmeraldas TaxID=1808958 RepID=A0AAW0F3F3_9TRYP